VGMPLITPTKQTLKRYGLSLEEWQAMAEKYNHACAICKTEPKKGRLHIDHEHVKGWKKMAPSERKKHVRCLACFRCNVSFIGRGITIARAQAVVDVLAEYALKHPGRTI